jgi:hypothetical protein
MRFVEKWQAHAAEEDRLRKEKAAEEDRMRQEKADEEARMRQAQAAEEARMRQEQSDEEARMRIERRPALPEFRFCGFTLSDSPQLVITKGLSNYEISTSFPVQQSTQAIKVTSAPQNFHIVAIQDHNSPLDQFFSHHKSSNGRYNLAASARELASGLRIDTIELQEKDDRGAIIANIRFYYFMLADGIPKALYMRVTGDIVRHVPEIFGKRYGYPEHTGKSTIWFTSKEAAIAGRENDSSHPVFYMVSQTAYNEYARHVAGVAAKMQAEEAENRRVADEARKVTEETHKVKAAEEEAKRKAKEDAIKGRI